MTRRRRPSGPPRAESRAQWLLALSVSVLAHGVAAGWALGLMPHLPRAPVPPAPREIRVSSLPVEVIAPAVVSTPEIAVLAPPDAAAPPAAAEVAAGEVPTTPAPDILRPQRGEVLLADPGLALPPSGGGKLAAPVVNAAIPLAPSGTGIETANLAAPAATPAPSAPAPARPAEPPPPLLLALIDGIRARVAEPCLLALPDVLPDGQVRLTVLADGDRQMSGFLDVMRALAEGASFAERRLLIDRRQCPALTWLRGAPGYPVFGLGLGLARDSLPSGEALQGAIGEAAGAFTTLLLVDDNGVVQDLGRFLLFSGGQARFDMPVTRVGAARDTGQILIAITTPERPEGLGALVGHRADAVFPKLSAALRTGALLGVAPFFVQ